MTSTQPPQPVHSSPSDSAPAEPFLSVHTTVVLLTALVIGLVIGGLTALTGVSVPAAVIAGLTSAGAGVPALRTLIQ
ncbi:hypothetical protein [Streptomyces sp. 6N106]|uniref:hypothetical protein n=1 Tax=Streptomyces sp. 6N106 TaxID=3457418 RepID=UPI003FCEF806